MAIVQTQLLHGSQSSSPTVTATVTPATDGSPILFFWANTRGTGTTALAVTAVSGLGLTWTTGPVNSPRDAGVTSLICGVYKGVGTASTGTISFTVSNSTGMAWQVYQFAGAHLTSPLSSTNAVGSTSTSAATSMALTLPSSPAVGSMVAEAVVHAAQEDMTAGTNFTKGTNALMGSPNIGFNVAVKTVLDTTVDASWSSNVGYNAIGIEIIPATAGGGGPTADTSLVGSIPI